jgi:hypothetical protein
MGRGQLRGGVGPWGKLRRRKLVSSDKEFVNVQLFGDGEAAAVRTRVGQELFGLQVVPELGFFETLGQEPEVVIVPSYYALACYLRDCVRRLLREVCMHFSGVRFSSARHDSRFGLFL